MTLQEIERALAEGRISARMNSGRQWQVRRNGATKLWKTRPGDFRIPVKAGFCACGYITQENFDRSFIVKEG
jgi:hypothetical protein